MDRNYKNKLQSLGVYFGSKEKLEFKSVHTETISELEGITQTNSLGELFYKERLYEIYHQHGDISFKNLFQESYLINLPDREQKYPLDKCLFIDTETTGLSYSGGTFAFMIGAGYFQNNEFIVRQYFLRNPMEEEAMLLDFENLVSNFDTLVSYNGISFDVPIIKTRFRYHRLPTTLTNKSHIDLLKYARMLFRYQFEDRSLKSIETNVLKFTRAEEEIPGFLAPIIYQEYLQTKDLSGIYGVFYHNEMDVVSLVALISIINKISLEYEDYFEDYETINFSLAKQFEKNKDYQKAIESYTKAIEKNNLPEKILVKSFLGIANLFKKNRQFEEAIPYWHKAAELNSIEALIELSKINEHQLKSYDIAINCCKQALMILNNKVDSIYKSTQIHKLDHRLSRLESKVKNE